MMEMYGIQAPRMDWTSANLPEERRRFKQQAELMISGPLREKREPEKCSYLLLWIGEKGLDIYNTWSLSEDEAKKLQTYYDNDEMVRDRIVFATNSPRVRKKLLSQGAELTLDKAIDIARSHELARIQLKEMTGSKDGPKMCFVNATKRQNAHRYTKTKDHKLVHRECDRCASSHSPREACPTRGKQLQNSEEEQCELYIDSITTVNANKNNVQAYADIKVGPSQQTIRFKIDSGVDINALPNNCYGSRRTTEELTRLGSLDEDTHRSLTDDRTYGTHTTEWVPVAPPTQSITAYGGNALEVRGTCMLEYEHDDRSALLEDLNKAIQRPNYPLPTLEEVTTKLTGARYFSFLDARSGYWTIKLSTESSMLTTFNTPFGRYRFLRLPFGINSAQDEFQRRVNETYEGLKGVAAIVDDILVYGRDKEEHDTNLRPMLQRTRERGLQRNPNKCRVGILEVSYFGHRLSCEGISPDPQKVIAIQEMQPPQSKPELETILRMVNYQARFTPHLSEVNAPLRQLLKQDSEFIWDAVHDRAFKQIQELITNHPVLTYFDPQMDLTLQVDTSKSGLGAVLLQHDKPVACASKSLNSTEQNYAQIDKELYTVFFRCKRFHKYMYSRKVTVESDHKPLEAILKKPLTSAPPRLQRMILQLQKYDIHILHKSGKQILVADTIY
ncbi:Retrovirus-related Pol polyprotein from transposon 17.6 [Labeo rohita]|uniref:ribonuclease H n=1 Tax=Labeo rohita TaxID=84645 RepID=A0ABQ8LLC7_LABRO|nr:Retrovirus-related Pol polyprotein from transposon 17.6 [Labeo rohita]